MTCRLIMMTMRLLIVAAVLATLLSPLAASSLFPAQPQTCAEWSACRQMALEAAERKEYEAFHDLAWRAVQIGPKNDPSLMSLLARAQSLSGRPHDALVMIRRLLEMKVAVAEAETSDDFRQMRSLADWPPLAARIQALGQPAPVPVVQPSATPAVTSAPILAKTPPVNGDEGLRFTGSALAPVALGYDAVSRRFVLADERSQTLKVIDERSRHVLDLVSARWAGPYRTTALEIDSRQGNLWVAGAQDSDSEGKPRAAVLKLQLVSGRLLDTLPLSADAGPARFTDLAVTDRSTIFVLDGLGRRIFRLGPQAKALALATTVNVKDPTGLAPATESVLYVSHPLGIVRLDLATRTSVPVNARAKLNLQGLRWIRWHGRSLVGMQERQDGSRVAVRLRLDRTGRRVTSLDVLDSATSNAATITGGVLYYLDSQPGDTETTVRRIRLP